MVEVFDHLGVNTLECDRVIAYADYRHANACNDELVSVDLLPDSDGWDDWGQSFREGIGFLCECAADGDECVADSPLCEPELMRDYILAGMGYRRVEPWSNPRQYADSPTYAEVVKIQA